MVSGGEKEKEKKERLDRREERRRREHGTREKYILYSVLCFLSRKDTWALSYRAKTKPIGHVLASYWRVDEKKYSDSRIF